MIETISTSGNRAAKARVIDGMLSELGMSRQELIELIKAVTEQSVSEDRLQNLDLGEIKQLELQSDEVIGQLPQDLSIEDMARYVAEGNIEYLSKYLSLEQIQKISLRIGLAFSLKRARELGITLDSQAINQIIGLPGIEKLMLNGKYLGKDGRQQVLTTEQAEALSKGVNALVGQRQLARSKGLDQQTAAQLAQITNDPNSFSNPAASVNIVQRVFSMVRSQMQNLGISPGSLTAGSSLAAQQQQVQQTQNLAQQTQRIYTQMRRHERRLRNMVPEISRTRRSGGDMFATVRTRGGEREVNLKDYLRGENRLTLRLERLINKISGFNEALDKNLKGLSVGLPEARAFNFDAAGRLQVQVASDKTMKLMQVVDYIGDLRRELDRMRTKLETKKQEAVSKKIEVQNKSDIQHMKDLSRGPELDNANLAAAKIAAEHESSLKFVTMQPDAREFSAEKVKKKEIKRVGDELVKLDALADKQKVLEAMKATGELKNIESSMKEAMKHMDEAEKNKDLLKDLKLEKKDKFIDKI